MPEVEIRAVLEQLGKGLLWSSAGKKSHHALSSGVNSLDRKSQPVEVLLQRNCRAHDHSASGYQSDRRVGVLSFR